MCATSLLRRSLLERKTTRFLRSNHSTSTSLSPDDQKYAHLLNSCLRECKLIQTRKLLDEMPQRSGGATRSCRVLHAQTLKHGFGLRGYLGNAIVDLYAKCGDAHCTRMAFKELNEKDVTAWNSVLSVYSRLGMPQQVVQTFCAMSKEFHTTPPNQYTLALVLSALSRLTAIHLGRQVHSCIVKLGFELNSFCGGSLIDMYAKCDCATDARRVFDEASDYLDTVSWTSMIAGYVRIGLPEEALKLFDKMLEQGAIPDQVAFVTVISACVGLGRLYQALELFRRMPEPNVVAWNVMISGHAQSGYPEEAMTFFRDMRVAGVKPTRSTLGSVLSAIASLTAIDQGQQVHSEAIKMGLDSNVYVGSSLINMYAKCRIMESARAVFYALEERNIVLWNAMLGGYLQNGHTEKVVEMFSDMRGCGFRPDEFTYTSVVSACASLESLDLGKQFHAYIVKSNLESNLFVGNAIVDMYAKSGDLKNARHQFELIKYRDNVSWNAIIVGYVHEEDEYEALSMFRKMNLDGILPDEVSLSSILSACANLQALEHGKQVHCYTVKFGFDSSIYAGSSLVDMYAKCRVIEAARKVFSLLPEQTVVSRNALISGYVQNNKTEDAIRLFQEMQREGLRPSKVTFANILVLANESSSVMNMGKQVHCYTLKIGILHDDEFLGVSLLGVYLKSDTTKEDAGKLFMEFPNDRSRVLWTAIISGHAQNGDNEEAIWLFREMRIDGVLPDQASFASVLSACAGSSSLKDGREVHCLVFQTGFNLDEYTCSALVDMYAKCGEVKSCVQVFNEMEYRKDVISWNSMIVGFSKNGYAEDSLRMFYEMRETSVKPDDITFLGVLTACSHAGLVSQGLEIFNSMIDSHGIHPRVDHYACMIDLLGRGGLVKEAEECIRNLTSEPDAMIWATFLAACRLHGDDIRGQWAAEKLIELEPQNSSPYVLLSNIHAESRNWNAVNAVRKSMRQKGVVKFPGCSWIVVGRKTNLFVAGDKSHPSAAEMCAVLKDLSELMKGNGHVAAAISSILSLLVANDKAGASGREDEL